MSINSKKLTDNITITTFSDTDLNAKKATESIANLICEYNVIEDDKVVESSIYTFDNDKKESEKQESFLNVEQPKQVKRAKTVKAKKQAKKAVKTVKQVKEPVTPETPKKQQKTAKKAGTTVKATKQVKEPKTEKLKTVKKPVQSKKPVKTVKADKPQKTTTKKNVTLKTGKKSIGMVKAESKAIQDLTKPINLTGFDYKLASDLRLCLKSEIPESIIYNINLLFQNHFRESELTKRVLDILAKKISDNAKVKIIEGLI